MQHLPAALRCLLVATIIATLALARPSHAAPSPEPLSWVPDAVTVDSTSEPLRTAVSLLRDVNPTLASFVVGGDGVDAPASFGFVDFADPAARAAFGAGITAGVAWYIPDQDAIILDSALIDDGPPIGDPRALATILAHEATHRQLALAAGADFEDSDVTCYVREAEALIGAAQTWVALSQADGDPAEPAREMVATALGLGSAADFDHVLRAARQSSGQVRAFGPILASRVSTVFEAQCRSPRRAGTSTNDEAGPSSGSTSPTAIAALAAHCGVEVPPSSAETGGGDGSLASAGAISGAAGISPAASSAILPRALPGPGANLPITPIALAGVALSALGFWLHRIGRRR